MLSSLLFGEYRQRALGLLLLNPEVSYHVRELERITGTSAGTLHKAYQACCWWNTEKNKLVIRCITALIVAAQFLMN